MADKEQTRSEKKDAMPMRQCAVSRVQLPQERLIRFVLDPSSRVVPDIFGKLPGRGVWVNALRTDVETAVKRNIFARGFSTSTNIPSNLAQDVEELLLRDVLQRLSLANKAGLVRAGFVKVDAALKSEDVAVILHAVEAGEDGREKIDRRYRAVCRDKGYLGAVIRFLHSEQLGLALGRSNVIHAALRRGGAAEKFQSACIRYQRYVAGREAFVAA